MTDDGIINIKELYCRFPFFVDLASAIACSHAYIQMSDMSFAGGMWTGTFIMHELHGEHA